MHSQIRIVVGTLLLAGLWSVGRRIPDELASMETFRVTHVEVHGARFISRAQVVSDLHLKPQASVWVDTDVLARRLEADPLVKRARVRRRIPSTLVVEVTERKPVALVPTPTLVPVDAEGRRLPIDPARHRLDLPVMESPVRPARGALLLPSRARSLAREVGRLLEADTAFHQMVSDVSEPDPNTVVARWSNPPVEFLLRPDTPARRLREGLTVLADALGREPGHPPTAIDLRYADQVVVRRSR